MQDFYLKTDFETSRNGDANCVKHHIVRFSKCASRFVFRNRVNFTSNHVADAIIAANRRRLRNSAMMSRWRQLVIKTSICESITGSTLILNPLIYLTTFSGDDVSILKGPMFIYVAKYISWKMQIIGSTNRLTGTQIRKRASVCTLSR